MVVAFLMVTVVRVLNGSVPGGDSGEGAER